jgi:chorismate dehydratase
MTLPTLRVGSVPYVVGRPLDLALGEEEGIELVHETPASLVQGLRTYRLDVALVSSIELFRQPGYRYIDGLAVAGDGFVSSVQVFLRKPIEEVRSLALDPASRTSQVLVQALLDDRPQGAPRCLVVEPGEDPAALEADAWLRIGDRALSEYWTEPRPAVFNPSQAWAEVTGLPFVFAAWIVRPGAAIEAHLPAFWRAREKGAAALDRIVAEAAGRHDLPPAALRRYLGEECRYELGGNELAASLHAFRDLAARVGGCSAELEVSPVDDARPCPA